MISFRAAPLLCPLSSPLCTRIAACARALFRPAGAFDRDQRLRARIERACSSPGPRIAEARVHCFFFFRSLGQERGARFHRPQLGSPEALLRAGPWPAPPQRAFPAAALSPSSAPRRARKGKSRPWRGRMEKQHLLREEGRRERRRRSTSLWRGARRRRRSGGPESASFLG